jgi:hypothetical protein
VGEVEGELVESAVIAIHHVFELRIFGTVIVSFDQFKIHPNSLSGGRPRSHQTKFFSIGPTWVWAVFGYDSSLAGAMPARLRPSLLRELRLLPATAIPMRVHTRTIWNEVVREWTGYGESKTSTRKPGWDAFHLVPF